MLRLALFISGGASTASAIIREANAGKLNITPVLVIASKMGITGIKRIIDSGFPKEQVVVIDQSKYKDRSKFGFDLLSACKKNKIDLVGQYGWLPLTPKEIISEYKGRIINQHPGPLDPPFSDFGGKGMYGRRVHAAILYFRRNTKHDFWTEAVSHFVTDEYDKGDIIGRQKIDIYPDDTVETLQARVLLVEHMVQINVLKNFLENNIKPYHRKIRLIRGGEEKILAEAKKTAILLYPQG